MRKNNWWGSASSNQGISIEELQAKTDIQMNLLEAMEADDLIQLPWSFYARSFWENMPGRLLNWTSESFWMPMIREAWLPTKR